MAVKKGITGNWPLFISIIVFSVIILLLFILSIAKNQGHLIYALDDAYIHMSMAKNFAQHGIWGITKYGFTSSSSSLLWTLLISSIFYIFGINEAIPFLLNIIFAFATIYVVYYTLKTFKISQFYTFFVLVSIIIFTPFPSLIFTGMEHTMQLFLTILFVYISVQILLNDEDIFKYLLFLAPLLTLTRYESLFLIIVICFLLILKKKYLYSILLGMVSLIPLGVYGMISTVGGWFFLPNSLVLKSFYLSNNGYIFSIVNILSFINHFINQLRFNDHIFILFSLSLLFLIFRLKNRKFKNLTTVILVIFILTTLLHLSFAETGWFYRYEAYLMLLGIFGIGLLIYELLPKNKPYNPDNVKILRYLVSIVLICIVIFPLADRGYESLIETPQATNNIYEQQYQMGLFVKQFYNNESIALNDIGAVNYLADVKCVDLYGLGNLQVAQAKKNGYFNAEELSKLVKENKIKVIIIYDNWFKGKIPSNWIKAGQWKIKNNIICGGSTVSFYTADSKEKNQLIENLGLFSSKMPKDIEIKIYS